MRAQRSDPGAEDPARHGRAAALDCFACGSQRRWSRGSRVALALVGPLWTAYLGVISDLGRRIGQHRTGAVEGFTQRTGPIRLVWVEPHPDIRDATQRERTMTPWSRAWTVRLILATNPDWRDLSEDLNA